ncbi:MAG: NUDIX domain-containing protein [Acidimicrobiales bacterium]|jgi:ADP-ribose pyrophosphatase YjhB (NUDIX family)
MTSPPPAGAPVTPVVAVGGVAVRDGALLLVRRATAPQAGRWTIPGGHVEPGEDLASAVEREMREETGLEVRCGPLLGWAERIGPGYHFVILDFTVAVPDGAPDPRAGSDAAAVAWVPLAEVSGASLVEGVEEFLRAHGVID